MGRTQQAIDLLFVSVLRRVSQKRRLLFGCRRKTGKVERDPAQQGRLVRLRRWRETFFFEPCEYKSIKRLTGPLALHDNGQRLALRRNKCPMVLPFSALFDPPPQNVNLLGGQRGCMVRHTG